MSILSSGRLSRLPLRYRSVVEPMRAKKAKKAKKAKLIPALAKKAKRLPALYKNAKRISVPRLLGWKPRHVRLSIENRRQLAIKKFSSNPLSDEYYTGAAAWESFAQERSLKRVWEPFAGDGKIVTEWAKLGVDCVMSSGDFWDNLKLPEGIDYIATNPPFSFKWLVLETLLEFKKPLAVILPWQSFYANGLTRLNWLQQEYGGQWKQLPMTSAGQHFWHPPVNDYKKIGCFILEWTW